jgi:hypothetical protein
MLIIWDTIHTAVYAPTYLPNAVQLWMTAALQVTTPLKMCPSRCRDWVGGGFRGTGDWSTDGQKTEERQLDFLSGSGFSYVWRGIQHRWRHGLGGGVWWRHARDHTCNCFVSGYRGIAEFMWCIERICEMLNNKSNCSAVMSLGAFHISACSR